MLSVFCFVLFCFPEKLASSCYGLSPSCHHCRIIYKDRYLYYCVSDLSFESANYHLLHRSTFCVLWPEYNHRWRETRRWFFLGGWSKVELKWTKTGFGVFFFPSLVEKWIRHETLAISSTERNWEVIYKGTNSRSCLLLVAYLLYYRVASLTCIVCYHSHKLSSKASYFTSNPEINK